MLNCTLLYISGFFIPRLAEDGEISQDAQARKKKIIFSVAEIYKFAQTKAPNEVTTIAVA